MGYDFVYGVHRHLWDKATRVREYVCGEPAYVERCYCHAVRIRPLYGHGKVVVNPHPVRDGERIPKAMSADAMYRRAVWLASVDDRTCKARMLRRTTVVIPAYLFDSGDCE